MIEPPPMSRGRGRPRDPDIDTAILRAAFELFVERGIDGASIEQIAKRAGVGKLTVYRRWSSKEELLAQAIESLILLAHPQLMRHSQLLPQSMTTMETHQLDIATGGTAKSVKHLPERLSRKNRHRVLKLSSGYRSPMVKHEPELHSPREGSGEVQPAHMVRNAHPY